MHAELNMRSELSINEEKYTAGRARRVGHRVNIELVLLETLLECFDTARVEPLCGENTHGSGNHRYQ